MAAEGGLHLASIAPATRDMLSSGRLSLREGCQGAMAALASKGVPTFVFSSGETRALHALVHFPTLVPSLCPCTLSYYLSLTHCLPTRPSSPPQATGTW